MKFVRYLFPILCLFALATPNAVLADEPVRVAVISGGHQSWGNLAQAPNVKLVDIRAAGIGHCSSLLVPIQRAEAKSLAREFVGASGASFQLPADWQQSALSSQTQYGLLMGPGRPAAAARDAWLDALIDSRPPLKIARQLTASQVPTDVILESDGDRVNEIAIDWNADTCFSPDEMLRVNRRFGSPIISEYRGEDYALVARIAASHDAARQPKIQLSCWIGAKAQEETLLSRLLVAAGQSTKIEVVAILFGSSRLESQAFAQAIEQAKDSKCHFAVLELPDSYELSEEVLSSLSRLSHRHSMPLVVDRQVSTESGFVIPAGLSPQRSIAKTNRQTKKSQQNWYASVRSYLADPGAVRALWGKPAIRSSLEPKKQRRSDSSFVPDGWVELESVPEERLPATIAGLASGQEFDRQACESHWFRAAERFGDTTAKPLLLLDAANEVSDRQWTYTEFFETGRRSRSPLASGTPGVGTPHRAWLLLQRPKMVDGVESTVPRCFQPSSPIHGLRMFDLADQRSWVWHYDHDPVAQQQAADLATGNLPSELIQRYPKPEPTVNEVLDWRQHLLSIDHPAVRKQNLDAVANASSAVLRICQTELRSRTGVSDWREIRRCVSAVGSDNDVRQYYAWAADAAYRRIRAVGYRELPDVVSKSPIQDWERQNQEFETAFKQLESIVDIQDPRFVLAMIRSERRRGNSVGAYELLMQRAYEGPSIPWFYKKQRDLWIDMGWQPLIRLGHARWFLKQTGQPVIH